MGYVSVLSNTDRTATADTWIPPPRAKSYTVRALSWWRACSNWLSGR